MKTVLTCIDGSIYSTEACKYAAWAATRLNAPVELLHVVEHHREHADLTDFTGTIGMDANAQLTEELTRLEEARSKVARLKGKASLEQAALYLQENGVLDAKISQRHGDFVETVLEYEHNALLMILGKRGAHNKEGSSQIGANFEGVVRRSVCPVFVSGRSFRPIERFLVAYDDSPSARKAIDFLCRSSLLAGLECLVLMVGRADAEHRNSLEHAAQKLNQAGSKAVTKTIGGNPASAIAQEAEASGADLLVMGAYGHSKLREFFVGSTTTKLAQASPIPLMLFR